MVDAAPSQVAADVESAAAGEDDIQDGQIEIAAGCLNQPVLAVATGFHFISLPMQSLGKQKGEIAFVFNQQDPGSYDATSFISVSTGTVTASAGRYMEKVVPDCAELFTSMVPRCASTIRFTRLKPRPTPGICELRMAWLR